MTAAQPQEVKGAALVGLVKLLKKRGMFDQMLGLLGEEAAEQLSERIRLTAWYPYELFFGMLDAIDRFGGTGDGEMAFRIGEMAARTEGAGVPATFTERIFSPDFQALVSRSMWKAFYRPGELTVHRHDEGGRHCYALSLTGFKPASKIHCANIRGWLKGLFISIGCVDVDVVHSDCQNVDADECVFDISWKLGTPKQIPPA